MGGPVEQDFVRRLLDDEASIHHGDAVGVFGHHAQIVRDQDHGHSGLAPYLAQEVEDLRLDGGVERGRRLVGDQEIGLAGQRHGDHHPLVHAAGKLVGIVLEALARCRDADVVEKTQRLGAGRRALQSAMQAQRLLDLTADAVHRVEAGRRILEDEGDALAAHPFQGGRRRLEKIRAVENGLAGDAGALSEQAEDGEPGHALAAPGLTDQPDGFTAAHAQVDSVENTHRPGSDGEIDRQAMDVDQGFHDCSSVQKNGAGNGPAPGRRGQEPEKFPVRKSMANEGAAFHRMFLRLAVNAAFWCSTV